MHGVVYDIVIKLLAWINELTLIMDIFLKF